MVQRPRSRSGNLCTRGTDGCKLSRSVSACMKQGVIEQFTLPQPQKHEQHVGIVLILMNICRRTHMESLDGSYGSPFTSFVIWSCLKACQSFNGCARRNLSGEDNYSVHLKFVTPTVPRQAFQMNQILVDQRQMHRSMRGQFYGVSTNIEKQQVERLNVKCYPGKRKATTTL